MARQNWDAFRKSAKKLKQNIKAAQNASEVLSKKCEPGYCVDVTTKEVLKISDTKSSSLRRFLRTLNSVYYLVTNQNDRSYIEGKINEITTELSNRPDGDVE